MYSENAATLFLDVEIKEIILEGLGDNRSAVVCSTWRSRPDRAEVVPDRRLSDKSGSFVQAQDCGLPLITMFPMATK